jgi:hypothetical protein
LTRGCVGSEVEGTDGIAFDRDNLVTPRRSKRYSEQSNAGVEIDDRSLSNMGKNALDEL